MRSRDCIGFITAIVVAAGCGNGVRMGDSASAPPSVAASAPIGGEGNRSGPQMRLASNESREPVRQSRSIIRNCELSVRVKSIESSERELNRLVEGEGGYVESSKSTDLTSDHPETTLSLRVPVATFDSTIALIESKGVLLDKKVGSQDVTGQLIDLKARLSTMAAEEETYQGLLRQAHSLKTAIELRDKLTELRSEIESIAGQRKAMSELATLSTIEVTLTQNTVVAAPAQDASWLQETWAQSSTFALSTARFLCGILVWFVTLAPFWLPAGWAMRRIVSKGEARGATTRREGSTIL